MKKTVILSYSLALNLGLAGAAFAAVSAEQASQLGAALTPLGAEMAGNAAGTGARIALLNRSARAEIEQVVTGIEKIETAIEPRFQEHFVAAMAFPHKSAPYPHLAQAVALPAPDQIVQRDRGRRRRA